MTPLDALAAAVRDRLLACATAPLPGLGTLARAHVSARVRVGPDGATVLLPPGEAVGLATRTDDPSEIACALARRSGATDEAGAELLRSAVDQLEARLAMVGEARLDGVGVFQRTSSGIRFGAAPELLAAVNRRYEGLTPVTVSPATTKASPAPETPVAPAADPVPRPAPPPDEPPGAVDILLDLIVNEPTEEDVETPAATPPPEAPRAEPAPSESAFVDEPAEAEPVVAVPFGSDDVSLHDVLPPTPPERGPGLEAPPQDTPDAPAEAPVEPVLAEAAEAEPLTLDTPTTEAPPSRAVPDGPALADLPPTTAQVPAAPATAPARSSHLAGWLLYAAVVLALAALLLWWTVEERRADPPMTTLTALAARPT